MPAKDQGTSRYMIAKSRVQEYHRPTSEYQNMAGQDQGTSSHHRRVRNRLINSYSD